MIMAEDTKKKIEAKDREIAEKVAEMIRKDGLSKAFKRLGMSEDIITRAEKAASEEESRKPVMLASYDKGVSAFDAIQLAKEKGMRLLSNLELDRMLNESDEWEEYRDALPVWSGTMAAYSKPGEKLGDSIEYADPKSNETWEFIVPSKFQGMKDCALVADKYRVLRDGKNVVVLADEKDISVVKNFPAKNGWYNVDKKTGMPSGNAMDESDKDARYLYRVEQRVGPVGRGSNGDYDDRRGVGVIQPSYCLGVLAVKDSPRGAAAEKQ